MKKKNILLLSYAFYPQNSPRSFRATELAKEFARQGYTVTVFTPKLKEHDSFAQKYGFKIKDLGQPRWKPIEIKGSGLNFLSRKFIRRISNLLFEYPHIELMGLVKRALKHERGYDALISFAVPYPVHWGVAAIWSKKSQKKPAKKWIADCGDPYMYAAHDTFKKMFYFHFFENNFLKQADYVTVPFSEMRNLFNQKYREKIKVIPQGFKFDKIELQKYKKHSVPTFAFSGTIMPGSRDPFSLIDYLISLGIDFKFIFYNQQNYLESKYKDLLGSKIIVRNYIPREQLIKELSGMDFLVNVNTDSKKGLINAIPTKLIDYRLSKRPVLSYEQSNLPIQTIHEFLKGEYNNSYVDNTFERYRIENVVHQFLNLIK